MTTTAATITTTDQNTGRPTVWNIEVAKPMPNANRTHMLIVSRPKGTAAYTMWADVADDGTVTRPTAARRAW